MRIVARGRQRRHIQRCSQIDPLTLDRASPAEHARTPIEVTYAEQRASLAGAEVTRVLRRLTCFISHIAIFDKTIHIKLMSKSLQAISSHSRNVRPDSHYQISPDFNSQQNNQRHNGNTPPAFQAKTASNHPPILDF